MFDNKKYKSLALLTDLYQLTMAYAYWKSGISSKESVFNLVYRKSPFQSGFTIACGLGTVIDYLENFSFDDTDIEYLASLQGIDDKPLFDKEFLSYLKKMKFECDIETIPEGTVVFPHEPLLQVKGPIIQAQILETPILNMINFQTLIATKAMRIFITSGGDSIIEFGLRRAQGIYGAIAASRAAYIGGCDSTSNLLAGKEYGIPVKGTHAHSWVMAFDDELEAFKEYAKSMPNNCVFLVDTYDSLQGVKNAVEAGKWLKSNGYKMIGIRLDSGDLAYLSIEARKILDEGGFQDAKIMASNNLDEKIIGSLKGQGAKINVWGVGTKLSTSYDQPALDGVYKLSAIRDENGEWRYTVKISEQFVKINTPGILRVRRFFNASENIADMIYDVNSEPKGDFTIVDPSDPTRQKVISASNTAKELLVPIFKGGKLVYKQPTIHEMREKAINELKHFHSGIKRFVNPHEYPVGLEKSLYELKNKLVMRLRKSKAST